MPVIDERRAASRSALRYRPLDDQAPSQPGPLVARASRRARSDVHTTTAPGRTDDFGPEKEEELPRSQRQAAPVSRRTTVPSKRVRQRPHPLFFIVAGMLVALLLWAGLTQALAWGNNEYNTIVYGYPRIFQIDQVVGHHDSPQDPSHFLAMNLKGRIIIIEIPGGDVSKSVVFTGPILFGPNSDLEPVTLRFVDLNGDGRPDMVIEVQGEQIVFLNDQGTFRPLKPGEQNQIMQRLRQLEQ